MSPAVPLKLKISRPELIKVLNSTTQNNGAAKIADELQPSSTTPIPTATIHAKEASPYYVTLSVTRATTTYTSIIQLGNSFPTTNPAVTHSTPSPKSTAQNPGIPTSNIVGIIVGVISGFGILAGVFYVYSLRARQFQRVQQRKRSRRGSTSTGRSRSTAGAGSGAPPPPPPPGGGGGPPPGPPPPEMPFPPAN
ncbi:hypothetical protein LSUE1_G000223 [Lachnellula suecica]|uniref:Mid2 domain-containing protein n=1 Tax=Lachnellula suecica TaxID=602035 RepID=A0A8T9CI12_9HELO|nr:hypothetical protein LSUE1_G000223 [Lachnellula suecica]